MEKRLPPLLKVTTSGYGSKLPPSRGALPPEKKQAKNLEQRFLDDWSKYPLRGINLVPQYHFHPTRKFRLDFAIPELKIGIELDGFGKGHQAIWSISNDHERQNIAAELGWVILRHTARTLGNKDKRIEAIFQLHRVIHIRREQLK